jgi:membrane protease YdiL (CAAX protease family)
VSQTSPPDHNFEPLTRIQILAAMGVTAVVLLVVAQVWLMLDDVERLAVIWSPLAIAQGLGLGLAITLASSTVYYFWKPYRQSADFYLEMVLAPLVLPDLVWLGVLPGLSEELLFRGVMLPAIGLNGFGVAISSLCFGVLHFSGSQQWAYVIWATVIGTILGLSALYTGNLLVPIMAHATTNLISSLLWKWNRISEAGE